MISVFSAFTRLTVTVNIPDVDTPQIPENSSMDSPQARRAASLADTPRPGDSFTPHGG